MICFVVSMFVSMVAAGLSQVPMDAENLGGSVEFYVPNANGGSQLINANDGLGEPLNVIISGTSDAGVLIESGLLNYARAIGFSEECLDLHIGNPMSANLGDGNGWVNQTVELRQDYGNPDLGTCFESLIGGNHFRVYRQNGAKANSGAIFLAVSKEEDVSTGHTPVPDGYNVGREQLVIAALGVKKFGGVTYSTTARNITGLIEPGSTGINHGIAQDGIVTLLTVKIDL